MRFVVTFLVTAWVLMQLQQVSRQGRVSAQGAAPSLTTIKVPTGHRVEAAGYDGSNYGRYWIRTRSDREPGCVWIITTDTNGNEASSIKIIEGNR